MRSLIALGVAFGVYFVAISLATTTDGPSFQFHALRLDRENPSNMSTNLSDYLGVYAKEIFRNCSTRGVVFPLFVLVWIGALLLRYDPPKSSRDPYVQLWCFSRPSTWLHEQLQTIHPAGSRADVNMCHKSWYQDGQPISRLACIDKTFRKSDLFRTFDNCRYQFAGHNNDLSKPKVKLTNPWNFQ